LAILSAYLIALSGSTQVNGGEGFDVEYIRFLPNHILMLTLDL
jgi:hypothetical protein